MRGHFCLVLHAHLPFVRHPEHERFLEESWFFEALLETYLPLLRLLEGWWRDRVPVRLTLSLSPTLCAMLADPLLQDRFQRRLLRLIDLAERETFRTTFDPPFQELAWFYQQRFTECLSTYRAWNGRLLPAFLEYQHRGLIELMTSSATHAVLPLLKNAAAVRAQVLVARDRFQDWFQQAPGGFWLPECAYQAEVEAPLREAGFRWFILETHALVGAQPPPRWGVYSPVLTPQGLAVFGRDPASARQVWSRSEGYPGDFRYRDFYRDIGFDLDLDYVEDCLPSPGLPGFTGIKYHRITGLCGDKGPYQRAAALQAVAEQARHFLETRARQFADLGRVMDSPPVLVAPYDAELFGHWWYEGIEFLDQVFRLAARQEAFQWMTPSDVLALHPSLPGIQPMASSWGEGGYWNVWLNEANHWIYPHLHAAQLQISRLSRQFLASQGWTQRALALAGNELLLAQSSDWPFILRTGGSPEYARQRVIRHLERCRAIGDGLEQGSLDETAWRPWEESDLVFPGISSRYWLEPPPSIRSVRPLSNPI